MSAAGADVGAACARDAARTVISDVSPELADLAAPQGDRARLRGLGDKDTTTEAIMRVNGAHNWEESSPRCGSIRPRPRISSMPTSPAKSLHQPGLCRRRKSGDGLAPTTAPRERTDSDRVRPFEQRAAIAQSVGRLRLSTPTHAIVRPDREPIFGRDWEEASARAGSSNSSIRPDKHTLGKLRRDAGGHTSRRRAGAVAAARIIKAKRMNARIRRWRARGWAA